MTIWCIFIDKYLGDGGRSALALIRILWIAGFVSARGLSLVAWQWIYLFAALTLLSVADVLFGMKCYVLSVFDYRKTFGRWVVIFKYKQFKL